MNFNARATSRQAASNFEALRNYDRGPVSDDYVLIRDVMVPMRDGVRLATDIYLPAKDGKALAGKFPAILDRTPYDKVPRAPLANDPEYFARRGYAFASRTAAATGIPRANSQSMSMKARTATTPSNGSRSRTGARQGRHQRLFLRCRHPACAGARSAAASRRDVPGLRHVELSQ